MQVGEETLSVEMLIGHFERRIRRVERETKDVRHGKVPCFPQLTVFLGDSVAQGFDVVTTGLFTAWPQFQDELCFLAADRTESGITYDCLSMREPPRAMTPEGVNKEIEALFGENTHFQDRGALFVYYILKTSALRDVEDFEAWIEALREVKRQTILGDVPSNEVLYILLDEGFIHKRTAGAIKSWLAEHPELYRDFSVVLLSSRLSDGRILQSWESCYRIVACSMLVSNNTDRGAGGALTGQGLYTARYLREDKPIADIGQVVVEGVLDFFRQSIGTGAQTKLSDEELARRLGITKEGTLTILDEYVRSSLLPQLPREEALDYFPRADDSEWGNLADLSSQELDELTMGTWGYLLDAVAAEAKETLRSGGQVRRELQARYGRYLRHSFSPLELMQLNNYLDDVRELLMQTPKRGVATGRVLEGAEWQLRSLLSSDAELNSLFAEMIGEQARGAESYFTAFNELNSSLGYLHEVQDASLSAFYSYRVRSYFDREGSELKQKFWALSTRAELYEFLCKVIDDVIGSDPVFVAAFEEEREQRLGDDARGGKARDYMRRQLMGEGVPQYLSTSFDLGRPIVAAILLKTGTELHQSLASMPGDGSYYYNTGYGNAAERLELYRVEPVYIAG